MIWLYHSIGSDMESGPPQGGSNGSVDERDGYDSIERVSSWNPTHKKAAIPSIPFEPPHLRSHDDEDVSYRNRQTRRLDHS